MKKNLYFATVFQRRNLVKEFFMSLFLAIASYPRLLLEVFVRKNMGERYFSMASVITLFVVLAALPFVIEKRTFLYVLQENILWYLFLAGFLYAANKRRLEIKRLPSVFDFARYSLAKGETNPLLYKFSRFKNLDIRTMQTLVEPAIFFVGGILLLLIDQDMLGVLLIVSSILFSLSFVAAFHYGDHKVMDEIDRIILSEDMVKAFVDDDDPSLTRGVQFYGRKPADRALRQKVVNGFSRNDEEVAEAI